MRIALVAPLVTVIAEPQRGGSQAFVADLARGLAGRSHDVHVYAASGSEVPGVRVIDVGVDHRPLAATLYRASDAPDAAALADGAAGRAAAQSAFARVYAAVRATGYDIVHNHAFDAPAVSLATDLAAPVVHTLHLPPDAAVASAVAGASRHDPRPVIACVSQHHASTWRRVIDVHAVLPPNVPTKSIRFTAAAGDGALFAGRLSPEKGAADAIEIACRAGLRIDVYGDPYDPEYARARIEPWRGRRGVEIHPGIPRAALWEAMGRAAVVVCPAKWEEPFGLVAAEAQACGTPVVAFRRGALPEVVRDRVTGFLVAADDIDAAVDAVGAVETISPSDCRRHAERALDFERTLDAHEALYRHAAGVAAETAIGV